MASSILLAGLAGLWAFKSAYSRSIEENIALARYERISSINLTNLADNYEIVDKWIAAIDQERVFRQPFSAMIVDDESSYKLKEIALIRKIISLNYKLRRTSIDLENLASGYWEGVLKIDSNPDAAQKEVDLKLFHTNIKEVLVKSKVNKQPIENDIVDLVGHIRAIYKVRRLSVFHLARFLSADIYPRVTQQKIESEVVNLKKEISEKTTRATDSSK